MVSLNFRRFWGHFIIPSNYRSLFDLCLCTFLFPSNLYLCNPSFSISEKLHCWEDKPAREGKRDSFAWVFSTHTHTPSLHSHSFIILHMINRTTMHEVGALSTSSPDITQRTQSFVFSQSGTSNTPGAPELTATLSHILYNGEKQKLHLWSAHTVCLHPDTLLIWPNKHSCVCVYVCVCVQSWVPHGKRCVYFSEEGVSL